MKKSSANTDFISIIKELEEVILAGSGADSFWEILKLLYSKLYAEKNQLSILDYNNPKQIYKIFELAKKEWTEIFSEYKTIKLSAGHLTECLKILETVKLLDTKLVILDAAFEYLLPKVAKGNRGQYFTPRHVIAAGIKMLNPKKSELIIDPACGSGGFLVETIAWVGGQEQFAANNVYGIDFDEKAFAVCKTMMLIAGKGATHIYSLNSLSNLAGICISSFDIVLTNPPFGGEVREEKLLQKYELAHDSKGNLKNSVERHILFLERIINLLKPGGRACIVVPQGILNNTSLSYIREWLFQQARILAIIGLDVNTFKPHTNVKTSLLLLQKWNTPPLPDYPVFMAVSKHGGKNKSGSLVYKNSVIESDLNEIAKAFRNFVEEQKLLF